MPLQLPTAGVAPNPTSKITVDMNLDARKAVTLPAGTPQVDFSDATHGFADVKNSSSASHARPNSNVALECRASGDAGHGVFIA